MKLDKKDSEQINWDSLDQGLVIQDCRIFSEIPLKAKKCELVLAKLLYLIYHGAKFPEQDATSIFFSITKTFQSKEVQLRRLSYILLRELAKTAQDVLIVTSSLTQDMTSKTEVSFRSGAVRVLGAVTDATMLVSLERFFKQAFLDNEKQVAAAALSTVYHFSLENAEAVRRWSSEISQYLSTGNTSSQCQYLALGILFSIKQNDRIALTKMFQQISLNSNPSALLLLLRIYAFMMQLKPPVSGFSPIDLKPYLRFKSKNDIVAVEAARVMCELHWLYERDLVVGVTTLQNFLTSGNSVIRFSAIKILNSLANKNPAAVSGCNVEIESLLSDTNRTVATLAVTTLLKTGTETSIDRLIKQMSTFVADISDEFKAIVVDAVKVLCLKFPSKYAALVEFLGSILREEGGYDYKLRTVEAIFEILNNIPESHEIGLSQLCEFIEDCEYPKLTGRVIQIIGDIGVNSRNTSELVRYIYNRLILENTMVRISCIGALTKFALAVDSLRDDVANILRSKCLLDAEDEVRDRAIVSLKMIARHVSAQDIFKFYDPVALEESALNSSANIAEIPRISAKTFYESLGKQLKPRVAPSSCQFAVEEEAPSYETRIHQLPNLSSLGELLSSHGPKILNELESECHVEAIVHVFPNNIVIEFICTNTISGILMESINAQVNLTSDQQVIAGQFYPVRQLKGHSSDSCFLLISCITKNRPNIHIKGAISLSIRDFDDASNLPTGPPSFESFPLSPFEVGFGDYVRPLKVLGFNELWDSGRLSCMSTITFEIPTIQSIQDAINLLVETFGCQVFDNSDRILPSSTVHALKMGGSLMQDGVEVPFMILCRIANVRQSIALEIQARSNVKSVSDAVLALIQ